jgi:hypothetical protein
LGKTLGDHSAQGVAYDVRLLHSRGVHDRQRVGHHLVHGYCGANRLAIANAAIIEGDAAKVSAEFRDLGVPAGPVNPDALDENNRHTFAHRSIRNTASVNMRFHEATA